MTSNYPVKAQLIAQGGGETIDFMFNPTELEFSRSMQFNRDQGARTSKGLPKVSFSYPEPYSLSVSNITFDTYESGGTVMTHINKLRKSVEFLDSAERPPIYIFTWGSQKYITCFVKSLRYKLTLFLPDGTPVRAIADLSLEEIDATTPSPGLGASGSPDRRGDSRSGRS
jgi:Contractile injection system tube protein